MLDAIWQYAKEEAIPRRWRILINGHLFLAMVVGVVIYTSAEGTTFSKLRVGELTGALLTYGAIALGFSLAGLTIALTLPDKEFAKVLALKVLPKLPSNQNAYSDLLFVFSWTGILHWIVIVLALCFSFLVGQEHQIVPDGAGRLRRSLVAVFATIVIYSVCQFLVTLITLSQVGQSYIEDLRRRK